MLGSRYDGPSVFSVATATTAALLMGTSSYWIFQCVSEYGWEGTLRYIWEGDPYPGRIRDYIDALNDVEECLEHASALVSSLEEGLQRAGLDSIDDCSPAAVMIIWESNSSIDLQKQLAKMSYDLDQYAAKVDQVILSDQDQADIKQRKKMLSKRIVRLMERTDSLVVFYKKAKGVE
jgi:hypothetical protein